MSDAEDREGPPEAHASGTPFRPARTDPLLQRAIPVAREFLGSSRQLIIGPEGSLSALVAAAVLALATAGSRQAVELAGTLALLVAACFVIARLLRLGWLADYLSRPVLVGYIHGVAVVLIVGQLGKLTGIDVDAADPVPQLVEMGREIGDVSWPTFAVGAAALALLLTARYLTPRLPAALIVVIGAIVASKALSLDEHGVAIVGDIPPGLPDLRLPSPSWEDVGRPPSARGPGGHAPTRRHRAPCRAGQAADRRAPRRVSRRSPLPRDGPRGRAHRRARSSHGARHVVAAAGGHGAEPSWPSADAHFGWSAFSSATVA